VVFVGIWHGPIEKEPSREAGYKNDIIINMSKSDSPSANSKKIASRPQTALAVSIPGNLPILRRSPIGRETDMQNLQHLLQNDETRLVTITGFGGAGKTTLSIHLAKMLAGEFSGGVYFINLAALTKIDDIPLEIAHTLKIRYEPGRNILEGFRDALFGRSILLVLDNFEHLVGGATFVAELLEVLPDMKIIATSRDPLQLRAEQVYPLTPLKTQYAVELFIQRAQSVKPDFKPADEDAQAIAELCRRLGGLPLAVELAALRTKLFSPQAMLSRLQPDPEPASRFLNLFSASAKDLPERQQSLRKTIAWSYGLLDNEEQRALRFASVFPGRFGILTLAGLLQLDEYRVIELSDSLADKHLIQRISADEDEPRFSILEAIREFAWDEIRAQGELSDIKQRYIGLYRDLAQKAETYLRGAEQTVWMDIIEQEYPNLILAMDIGAAADVDSALWFDGLWILSHLEHYWMSRALYNDFTPLAQRGLELIKQSDLPDERALALKASLFSLAGTSAWLFTNFKQALAFHEDSLSISRALQDESRAAFSLNNIAVNLTEIGEYEKALECYLESLSLYEKLGDHWGQTRLHWNLCNYYTFISRDFSKVAHHNERGLYHAERSGDLFMLSAANLGIGEFYMLQGDREKSQARYAEAARLSRRYRYHQPLTNALTGLASLALLRGHLPEASDAIREGLPLAIEQNDRVMMGGFIQLAAWLAALQHQLLRVAFLAGLNESLWRGLRALDTIPDMWGGLANAIQTARAALGEKAFNLEYERGQAQPLAESIAFVLDTCLTQPETTASAIVSPFETLTERENETLRLLAQGKTNQQISQELFVTLKTVEKHVSNILRKLEVKNRTEAASWMLENRPE
jgi:predicted ATPase/DNA-binding CsgD family transcriptional regulator